MHPLRRALRMTLLLPIPVLSSLACKPESPYEIEAGRLTMRGENGGLSATAR